MAIAVSRVPAVKPATPAQLARYFEAKLSAELGPHNVKRLLDADPRSVIILDVRSGEGYREGHVPGAVHIPFEELPERMKELPKGKDIIIYCWNVTCILCTKAAYVLAKRGYRAKEMLGGMAEWRKAGFPVEPHGQARGTHDHAPRGATSRPPVRYSTPDGPTAIGRGPDGGAEK